jgi:phosphate transport system protein
MSHLEERLERDLSEIRDQMALMADNVDKAIGDAIYAFQHCDVKLANSTVINDLPINRASRRIDKLCHAFIALHLPSAGHLRLLSSVIRGNIILERIGDYAVTIAREAIQIDCALEGHLVRELERVGGEVRLVLSQAITSFNNLNADMARGAIGLANQLETNMDSLYVELMANKDVEKVRGLMITMVTFTQLKRVADQAKNLCEETIFSATGEAKTPKVYHVLFLDEDNSCLSQMAAAIAKKAFPESGQYDSAGRLAASAINPDMQDFLEGLSIDLGSAKPIQVCTTREDIAHYHVIVSLQGPVQDLLVCEIPFRTAALEWDVGTIPDGADTEAYEALYSEIALQVRELMILLRGEEAA